MQGINNIEEFVAEHKRQNPHLYRDPSTPSITEEVVDCSSDAGITIGLIDGMIAMARIVASRDWSHHAVREALADFKQDATMRTLMGIDQ